MKSKIVLISLILFFIRTSLAFTNSHSDLEVDAPQPDSVISQLYLYGEHIYQRENCGRCHSLNISDSLSKISLDGLAGKYPLTWHFNHLVDPRLIVINSEMPSFEYLSNRTIEKDTLAKYSENITPSIWNDLVTQTGLMEQQLSEFGNVTKSNSEILALIYFLDNIPQSAECKLVRLKEAEQAKRESEIRDSLWADASNVISQVLSKPESIEAGHVVFMANCTPCHGMQGGGIIGPNLTDAYWLHGSKEKDIVNTIINGVPEKGMMSWKLTLTPTQIGQLTAYIKSIRGSNPKNAKERQGVKE